LKPRPKPDSGNPTVRDCRGAPGNVTEVERYTRLDSIPTSCWDDGEAERSVTYAERTRIRALHLSGLGVEAYIFKQLLY
jgi:hypothetical protein